MRKPGQGASADPDKQWRERFSARTLAHSWEAADGLPSEVAQIFATAEDPRLSEFVSLLAVPEFKVPLPGGRRPLQNDLCYNRYSNCINLAVRTRLRH